MNSGHVAVIDNAHLLDGDDIRQTGQQTTDGGYDWVINPTEAAAASGRYEEMPQDVDYVAGHAAWTKSVEEDVVEISAEGEIFEKPEQRTTVERGEWLLIPDAALAIVSDENIKWHLSRMLRGADVVLADLTLREWADDHDDADIWGGGFSGRAVSKGVNKGAVYGEDVRSDPDLGKDIDRGPLTDIGVEYHYAGLPLKAYMAQSGYVAAYGDDWSVEDFVPWVVDAIEPYTLVANDRGDDADDDETNASPDLADADPDQTTLDEGGEE